MERAAVAWSRMRASASSTSCSGASSRSSTSSASSSGLGAIELLAHVLGDGRIEVGFRVGEPVRHGVGDPLRKQRPAVELQQPLLDHAPHQVRDVGRVDPVAEAALETVAVEQGEEELEVLLLAVVRRCRPGAARGGAELREQSTLWYSSVEILSHRRAVFPSISNTQSVKCGGGDVRVGAQTEGRTSEASPQTHKHVGA